MVVPPSFGSAIAVPAQETWYWMLVVVQSLQAPAVLVFEPSVKLFVVSAVPLAVYFQRPVIVSALPPSPIWYVTWFTSTVQLLRMQPRRLSSAQVPPSIASVSRTLIWSRSPDPR